MAQSSKRKQVPVKKQSGPFVPQENVLDLRSILEERRIKEEMQTFERPKHSRWSSWFRRESDVGLTDQKAKEPQKQPESEQSKKTISKEEAWSQFFVQEEPTVAEPENVQEPVPVISEHEVDLPLESDEPPAMPPDHSAPRTRRHRDPGRNMRRSWAARAGMAVGAVAVVVVFFVAGGSWYTSALATKERVLGASTTAIDALSGAKDHVEAFEFQEASQDFAVAQESFQVALKEIASVGTVAKWVPVKGAELRSGEALVQAGYHLSSAGALLMETAEAVTNVDLSLLAKEGDGLEMTTILEAAASSLDPASAHLKLANLHLQNVRSEHVPLAYRDTIQQAKSLLPPMVEQVEQQVGATDVMLSMLGHEDRRQYLVLFQNPDEIRPTGGFPGSIAVMGLKRGRIDELTIPSGGVYDVSGQLHQEMIAPQPLHLVNPHWNLQDANWHANYPDSAKRMLAFYQEAAGESLDGMIAVTPEVLKGFLTLVGPITLDEPYTVTVTAENVIEFLQSEAEEKTDTTTQPKAVIAHLAPEILQRVLTIDAKQIPELLTLLRKSVDHQDLMIYAVEEHEQQLVSEYGWSGEILSTDGDYLMVVNANIGGGKTDGVIDQLIQHEAQIQPDGRIIDTVTVTRTHQGVEGAGLSGVRNVNYIRFYVPQGSRLLESEGFEQPDPKLFLAPSSDAVMDDALQQVQGETTIDEFTGMRMNMEAGKTVFGNWVITSTGQTSKVQITYELPFRLDVGGWWNHADRYAWIGQRQAGTQNTVVEHSVILPESWRVRWQEATSSNESLDGGTQIWRWPLDQSVYTALIVEEQ